MADSPSIQTTQTFDTPGRSGSQSGAGPGAAGAPQLPDYDITGQRVYAPASQAASRSRAAWRSFLCTVSVTVWMYRVGVNSVITR